MSLFKALRLTATARVEDGGTTVQEARRAGPEWRGAELLVGAVAVGYATELLAAARRLSIPVDAVQVEASGHLTARRDDRYGLVGIDVDAFAEGADPADERLALAGELARDRCVVAGALDVPLSHRVQASPRALQEAAS